MLAVSLLIYLPAPVYPLWIVAAIVTEIPLPLSLLGLVMLGVSQFLFSFGRHRLLALSTTIVAALAISLNLTLVQNTYIYADKAGLKLDPIAAFSLFRKMPFVQRPVRTSECQRNVEYARRDGKPLLLDSYLPTSTGALGKVIIVVHGGSWKGGKRSDFAAFDYWLADSGYMVYDIDYRLAQDGVRYPAGIEDIRTAVDYARANNRSWHDTPDDIALLGRSAGGQMVLDAAYLADLSGKPLSKCVVGFYGPTDLAWDYANPVEPDVINARSVLENYLGGNPSQKPLAYKDGSPALNVCQKTQPTLLFHGLHDQLVAPQNTFMLEAALKKQNRTVETCILPWANHGFDWNFNGFSSQISRVRLLKFLNQYL